jgi:pimeloyl-ACP methyl ester carboxylesterase
MGDRFHMTDDGALRYSILGDESAPRTLVCHPGGPGMSAAYFGDMAGLGSGSLRVVLLDPRGTGGTSPPADGRYELARYAADIDALRAHLGLERIDLLGHSHGGFVAIVYALEYPQRLGRLVLACSAPRFAAELRDEAQAAYARHSGEPWYEDALDAKQRRQGWDFETPEEAAALYAREIRLWFSDGGSAADAFLDAFTGQRPDLDALRYFNERLARGYDMRPRLHEITAPTLILNCAHDFFGPQISASELSAIPGSRVIMLPDAGHWPFYETPERFRAEIEAFLAPGGEGR